MKLKKGRKYRHDSGMLMVISANIKSICHGKCLIAEIIAKEPMPVLKYIDPEKDYPGWHLITDKEFGASLMEHARAVKDSFKQVIEHDHCVREVIKHIDKGDCKSVMLTCAHELRFENAQFGSIPKLGQKMHCVACAHQQELIQAKNNPQDDGSGPKQDV